MRDCLGTTTEIDDFRIIGKAAAVHGEIAIIYSGSETQKHILKGLPICGL